MLVNGHCLDGVAEEEEEDDGDDDGEDDDTEVSDEDDEGDGLQSAIACVAPPPEVGQHTANAADFEQYMDP